MPAASRSATRVSQAEGSNAQAGVAEIGGRGRQRNIGDGRARGACARRIGERQQRHERQEEAGGQQRPEQRIADGRHVEPEDAEREQRHANDQRHLHAPGSEVRESQEGHSSISSVSRRIMSLSSFESRPSFASCTSSGAAAPSNTRSRKSRTIAPITWWRGCAGR